MWTCLRGRVVSTISLPTFILTCTWTSANESPEVFQTITLIFKTNLVNKWRLASLGEINLFLSFWWDICTCVGGRYQPFVPDVAQELRVFFVCPPGVKSGGCPLRGKGRCIICAFTSEIEIEIEVFVNFFFALCFTNGKNKKAFQ